ncbi:MAG: Lrp/AsnC family transcriptional regulator [Candidatus Bathyarchaeota archaeon]
MSAHPKIDEIDVKILKILLNDARTPFSKIGKECGLSSNSIRLRFKQLKKAGIINGSIIQVNPKSLGRDYIAFIFVQTDIGRAQQIFEFLKNAPNIIHITKLIGRYNILIITALTAVNDIDQVIKYVKGNQYVKNVDFGIASNVVNVDYHQNLEIKKSEGK